MRSEFGEIIGIVIHIVSVAGLARATVTSPVMGDDPIAMIQEEHHLGVPVIRAQRPAVAEDNRLSLTPVLVIDLRPIFCRDRTHTSSSYFSLIYTVGLPKTSSATQLAAVAAAAPCAACLMSATTAFGCDT